MSSSTKNGIHWQGNADRIAQAYETMNKFLAAFFQHVRETEIYIIKKCKLNLQNVNPLNENWKSEDACSIFIPFTILFQAIRELDYEIKEKAFLEKLLDIELADTSEKAILYADDGSSFDRVLFHGMEFTLFSFDLALFCCTEMLFGDYLLAAIVTALVAKVFFDADLIKRD